MLTTSATRVIEVLGTGCGVCQGSLKDNGWGGTFAIMTVTAQQAGALPAADVIKFHGECYGPRPVCTRCLHPELYAERMTYWVCREVHDDGIVRGIVHVHRYPDCCEYHRSGGRNPAYAHHQEVS